MAFINRQNELPEKVVSMKKHCTCYSQMGYVVKMPDKHIHNAMLVCWNCLKFNKWLSASEFERAKKKDATMTYFAYKVNHEKIPKSIKNRYDSQLKLMQDDN